jgi:hypothetical protein
MNQVNLRERICSGTSAWAWRSPSDPAVSELVAEAERIFTWLTWSTLR